MSSRLSGSGLWLLVEIERLTVLSMIESQILLGSSPDASPVVGRMAVLLRTYMGLMPYLAGM